MAAPATTVPPQNVEAEESVIGALMVAEPTLGRVINEAGLEAEDFYLDRHRRIFEAITALFASGKPVDELTVSQKLDETGKLDEAGGRHYVSELAAKVPAAGNARHYADIVKDLSRRRRILGAGQTLVAAAGDPTLGLEEAMAAAESAVLGSFEHRRAGGRIVAEGLSRVIDRQEAMATGDGFTDGVRTGFVDLDELVHDLRPGTMTVVAARPSMGKSALVGNIIESAVLDQGKAVLFQSLEMTEEEVIERMLASRSKVPLSSFRRGRIGQSAWPKIMRTCNSFEGAPLYIDDSGGLTSLEITMRARALHRQLEAQGGLDLIVLDYLQQIRSPNTRTPEYEKVTDASISLKALAKDLDVPVLVVSQLSRAPEQRPDKRPQLSDLRQSGQIEQDADVVIFIYREEYYDPESDKRGVAEVNVAKQRNGPLGRCELTFNKRFAAFANHAGDPFEAQARALDDVA